MNRSEAFDVELGLDYRADVVDVRIADVTLVGTGMDGDAVSPEFLDIDGCLHHIGHIATARVAYRGNLVDVYA